MTGHRRRRQRRLRYYCIVTTESFAATLTCRLIQDLDETDYFADRLGSFLCPPRVLVLVGRVHHAIEPGK